MLFKTPLPSEFWIGGLEVIPDREKAFLTQQIMKKSKNLLVLVYVVGFSANVVGFGLTLSDFWLIWSNFRSIMSLSATVRFLFLCT